jgi:hypothetical protein
MSGIYENLKYKNKVEHILSMESVEGKHAGFYLTSMRCRIKKKGKLIFHGRHEENESISKGGTK